jgi:hypothetical protein
MKKHLANQMFMRILRVIDDLVWDLRISLRYSRFYLWLRHVWKKIEPVCGKQNGYMGLISIVFALFLMTFYVLSIAAILP